MTSRLRLLAVVAFLLPFALQTPLGADEAVVARHRAQFPTPLGAANTVALLRLVARDVGGGLLRKDFGHHCEGFACDIICFADGRHFDVLRDSDGAAEPQWSLVTQPPTIDPARCELVTSGPPPPPPPPPAGDVLRELRALRALVERLAFHLGVR